MSLERALLIFAAFAISAVLTGLVRRFALSKGLLDVPNVRSSHTAPTPRGGGVAIVLASIGAFCVLAEHGLIGRNLFMALVGGGLAVATIGFLDDRWSVSAPRRLVVHVGSAIWALAYLGLTPDIHLAGVAFAYSALWYIACLLGIVWVLNLYNFMDGIDGIAASEAMFVSWGGALLLLLTGGPATVVVVAVAFGSACCGFLLWNWPPAKIFMGDVGSGYLGYVIAVIALAAAQDSPSAVWIWLILGGVFFVDATVTLIRRGARGERVFEAHRSHAYQWLARRWVSHKKVTLGMLAINILWLLPCAYVAALHPRFCLWIVWIALVPLVVLVLLAGGGRLEAGTTPRGSSARMDVSRRS